MSASKNKMAFTLAEVLIAVLLVGLALFALITANIYFTQANATSTDMTTAEFLIEQIRAITTLATYDDLDDFNDVVFSPPIAADRTTLTAFNQFSQLITVQNISASNFETIVTDPTDFVRITVKILAGSKEISSATWIRARL